MAGLDKGKGLFSLGYILGFALSYFLFTTVLFWVLRLKGSGTGYEQAVIWVLMITAAGMLLKGWLKAEVKMWAAGGFFTGLKGGMKSFGECLSTIVNTVLLLIVYIIGVGFTSLFAKISRKHFLESGTSKKRKSYWIKLSLKKEKIGNYYKQF